MSAFDALVADIPAIGVKWHGERILANSLANAPHIVKTIRDIPPDPRRCLIISAGPSLYRERILTRLAKSGFNGCIVATDGAYIQCLKAGIRPDWVITLDPHPTRMVRWFGDPDFEANSQGDDYFERQDLDVDFRNNAIAKNAENIALIDAHPTKLAICTTSPANVEARTRAFDRYWFAPLVDGPRSVGSLTSAIVAATGAPAINTGGTVGTAAWVFAQSVLKSHDIAVIGMDYGYYLDTPHQQTQCWNMVKDNPDPAQYFPVRGGFWGKAYTDPTYEWYLRNFKELLDANFAKITNCSGAGLLWGGGIHCEKLEDWLHPIIAKRPVHVRTDGDAAQDRFIAKLEADGDPESLSILARIRDPEISAARWRMTPFEFGGQALFPVGPMPPADG